MSEFDLIRQYFHRSSPSADLGVGDDAAIISVGAGKQLVVSTDMLVEGRHFFADVDPFLLGHKSLAVNLSDIAAMGATPKWATLAIALPNVNHDWLARFSAGFFALAQQHGVDLVGGDTTGGPLTISIQIMGEVDTGLAICRHTAQPMDDIWVSGCLGDAALGLHALQGKLVLKDTEHLTFLRDRLERPVPRCELGLALVGKANAMLDISDGLAGDLGHIAQKSHLTAEVDVSLVPVSDVAAAYEDYAGFWPCILAGGDDYELCFTAPCEQRDALLEVSERLNIRLTRIGRMQAEPASRPVIWTRHHQPVHIELQAFDHFSPADKAES
ncbi:thiamine-phosphate kinase [Leeia oryzae]|uniref:thiamine-phosphate kinase n=1 Tax=Leeia oryzae TaxID=356662 RepID=UPI0003717111|nr:thiamine-phosphate kinase [Leeia oryzae]